MRQEVLRRLGARLPPEMQLLDAAMAAADSKARMELLRKYALPSEQALAEALAGGEGEAGGIRGSLASAAVSSSQAGSEGLDRASSASSSRSAEQQPEGSGAVPVSLLYCLAADLERAASQVIRDMELMMEVPDRWGGSCWRGREGWQQVEGPRSKQTRRRWAGSRSSSPRSAGHQLPVNPPPPWPSVAGTLTHSHCVHACPE